MIITDNKINGNKKKENAVTMAKHITRADYSLERKLRYIKIEY